MASNNTSIPAAPPASYAPPPSAPAATAEEVIERQEEDVEEEVENEKAGVEKWPGWPGYNVFRLIVGVSKVGSIIGRKGELVKKMCDETGARIRILEGPLATPDRIVCTEFPFSPLHFRPRSRVLPPSKT